jgi:hypothetical protein
MKMKRLLLLFVLFSPLFFLSQNLNPVKWEAKYTNTGNNEGLITMIATIDEHWHIYSQRPTNDGPIPTSFTFNASKDFELIGKAEEIGAKEEFVKAFDAKLFTFEKTAVFKQKVKRNNAKAFNGGLKVEYMTCNDMQCLPPKTVDLTFHAEASAKK